MWFTDCQPKYLCKFKSLMQKILKSRKFFLSLLLFSLFLFFFFHLSSLLIFSENFYAKLALNLLKTCCLTQVVVNLIACKDLKVLRNELYKLFYSHFFSSLSFLIIPFSLFAKTALNLQRLIVAHNSLSFQVLVKT